MPEEFKIGNFWTRRYCLQFWFMQQGPSGRLVQKHDLQIHASLTLNNMKILKVMDRCFARSCKIIVNEADSLEPSTERVQNVAHLVQRGSLLNEMQCTDIAIKNIQELISHNLKASTGPFRPALEHFNRISEKAKLLVIHCSDAKHLYPNSE